MFVENQTIRSQAQFESVLAANKPQLVAQGTAIGKLLAEILSAGQQLRLQLNRPAVPPAMRQDIEQQLDLLLYAGFIRHTPLEALKAVPRYLKAMSYRVEKLKTDTNAEQELARYWKRYWKWVEAAQKREQVWPERDAFRWALEEFRVSLFAQQLKTPYPISAKRLEKMWDERF